MTAETPLTHTDIAIVGGGPVGAALALGLADSGHHVTVLEARTSASAPDPRAIALSEGSRLILRRLGVWEALAPRATPITRIHVSQRGGFGRTELKADELAVPALGYVAEYGDLYAALGERLRACGVSVLDGARVTQATATAGYGLLHYTRAHQPDAGPAQEQLAPPGGRLGVCEPGAVHFNEHTLTARLVVLSEGGKALPPTLRRDKDYAQAAVLSTVRTTEPHAHRAYERFTPDGPIALLPLGDAYALVWTTPADQAEARLALDDAEFLRQLQAAFGERQGRFTHAGPRTAFPLRMAIARDSGSARLIRIGNAAHVLHPVAGQGFNLGLRDAWKLAEALIDLPQDRLGEMPLSAFQRQRAVDISGGGLMTDLLVAGFTSRLPGARGARGLALAGLDLLPGVRGQFARKMMFGAQTW